MKVVPLKKTPNGVGDVPGATRKLTQLQARVKQIEFSRRDRLERRKQELYRAQHSKDAKQLSKAKAAFAREFRVKELNDKQRHAISLLVDFVNRWPDVYIARQVGVNIHTLRSWKNDPFFLGELDKEITRRKTFIRLKAFRNFFRLIDKGNLKATLAYFKMTGDLEELKPSGEVPGAGSSDAQLDKEIQRLQDELGLEVVESRSG